MFWVERRLTRAVTMGRDQMGGCLGGLRIDLWGRRLGVLAVTNGRSLKRPAPSNPLRVGFVIAMARDSLALREARVVAWERGRNRIELMPWALSLRYLLGVPDLEVTQAVQCSRSLDT